MHFYGQSSSDILGAGWRSGRSDEILNVDAVFAHLENIPEKKKKKTFCRETPVWCLKTNERPLNFVEARYFSTIASFRICCHHASCVIMHHVPCSSFFNDGSCSPSFSLSPCHTMGHA